MASKIKSSGTQLLNIPNTPEGLQFFKQFQKYRNPAYHITRRGRGSRKNGLGQQSHIPLSNAKWFALYINEISRGDSIVHNLRLTNEKLHEHLERVKKERAHVLADWYELNEKCVQLDNQLSQAESDLEQLHSEYYKLYNVWWRRVARRFYHALWWLSSHKISIQIKEV